MAAKYSQSETANQKNYIYKLHYLRTITSIMILSTLNDRHFYQSNNTGKVMCCLQYRLRRLSLNLLKGTSCEVIYQVH